MISFVKEITERFGGRLPGSLEEKAAQHYVHKKLRKYCSQVYFHEFESAVNSKFNSLFVFAVLFFASLGLYWYSLTSALVVAAINLFLFFGHFVLQADFLDLFYQNRSSVNVVGTLEPQEKATSTIILAAHIDSTREFFWFYWFRTFGMALYLIAGALLVLLPLFYTILFYLPAYYGRFLSWPFYVWLAFLFLSPAMFSFLKVFSRKIIVDGAIDNLSGLAINFDTIKHFSDPQSSKSKLKNTRLRIISFGSEECGLKGSHEYVKAYSNEIKEDNSFVINVDTIKDSESFAVLKGELMPLTFYNKELISKVKASFDEEQVPCITRYMAAGSTDGTSFVRHRIPATTIVGVSLQHLDPTYHTRLDKVENLPEESLKKIKSVLIRFIENWDNNKQT